MDTEQREFDPELHEAITKIPAPDESLRLGGAPIPTSRPPFALVPVRAVRDRMTELRGQPMMGVPGACQSNPRVAIRMGRAQRGARVQLCRFLEQHGGDYVTKN